MCTYTPTNNKGLWLSLVEFLLCIPKIVVLIPGSKPSVVVHARGRKAGGAVQGQPQPHKVPGQPGLQKTPSQREKKICSHGKSYFSKYSRAKKSGKKITGNNILLYQFGVKASSRIVPKGLLQNNPAH